MINFHYMSFLYKNKGTNDLNNTLLLEQDFKVENYGKQKRGKEGGVKRVLMPILFSFFSILDSITLLSHAGQLYPLHKLKLSTEIGGRKHPPPLDLVGLVTSWISSNNHKVSLVQVKVNDCPAGLNNLPRRGQKQEKATVII